MTSNLIFIVLSLTAVMRRDFPQGTAEATSALPAPQNLKLNSINMDAVLEWTPPQNISSNNISYTALYWSHLVNYTVCSKIKETKCDFGSSIAHLGIYTFGVRAELQGSVSSWTKSQKFQPFKDTTIGEPTVQLISKGDTIEVKIKEPMLKVQKESLESIYRTVNYVIKYWEEGRENEVSELSVKKSISAIKIREVQLLSRCCVQARVHIPKLKKVGLPSKVVCLRTSSPLVGYLVTAAVSLPLLILGIWLICKGRKFLYPKINLPQHFKQYLTEAPRLIASPAMQNSKLPKEDFDRISDMFEDKRLDELTNEEESSQCGPEEGPDGNEISEEGNFPYYNVIASSSAY